ncbi:MAG: TadE/TadG family type IV pilus assembly protein [Alphaproteobacteria bacterium]
MHPRPLLARFLANTTGAALLEFAFVAPVLLWLIMGILEFGLIMHVTSLLQYATNEGARQGITGSAYGGQSREATIRATITKDLGLWVNTSGQNLTIQAQAQGDYQTLDGATPPPASDYGTGGEFVMYKVTLNWRVLTPVMGHLLPAASNGILPLQSTALVKNEDF